MGRTQGRTAHDTRRALLDAAGEAIRTRGVHVTLDEIAHQAGVSKGGLIYHFASKDQLILELARDRLTRFRVDVSAHLDPGDTAPGSLTRAYLRTVLAPDQDEAGSREEIALITQLMTIPEVADLARRESEELKRLLDADGLPPDVLALVIATADGISSAPLWGASTDGPAYQTLGGRLIELTERPDMWQEMPWGHH